MGEPSGLPPALTSKGGRLFDTPGRRDFKESQSGAGHLGVQNCYTPAGTAIDLLVTDRTDSARDGRMSHDEILLRTVRAPAGSATEASGPARHVSGMRRGDSPA